MKKIIAAWIEQILEFDTEDEYELYAEKISQTGKKWKSVIEYLENGKLRVRIQKQYNNNTFPDELEGGE